MSDIIHTALSHRAQATCCSSACSVLIRSVISYFLDREMRDIRDEFGDGGR